MTANLFYIEADRIDGRRMILEGPEHHHLARVVRSRTGETVRLFDENGARYEARIDRIEADRTELMLLARLEPSGRRSRILLGQALLKAKAMDLVVQKAAEFGLFAVVPIRASRSVARADEDGGKKVERWAKIAREASKQSKWGLIPRIHPPQDLSSFLRGRPSGPAFFLSEGRGRPLKEIVLAADGPPAEAAALVGPEGGWTRDEEKAMAEAGLEPVSLGRAVLRAETAAISAAAILSHFWVA